MTTTPHPIKLVFIRVIFSLSILLVGLVWAGAMLVLAEYLGHTLPASIASEVSGAVFFIGVILIFFAANKISRGLYV